MAIKATLTDNGIEECFKVEFTKIAKDINGKDTEVIDDRKTLLITAEQIAENIKYWDDIKKAVGL